MSAADASCRSSWAASTNQIEHHLSPRWLPPPLRKVQLSSPPTARQKGFRTPRRRFGSPTVLSSATQQRRTAGQRPVPLPDGGATSRLVTAYVSRRGRVVLTEPAQPVVLHIAESTASLGRSGRPSNRRDERHRSARHPRVTCLQGFPMAAVQPPYRVSRRDTDLGPQPTLHDEVS